MSWLSRFFSRRQDDDYETFKSEVPFSTLTRWYLYDMSMPEPNELAVSLGLTPVSDEGEEKEEEDSEERLAELQGFIPYLDIISELNAKIITIAQLNDLKKNKDVDEEIEQDVMIMRDLYHAVGFSALISAFSFGLKLGIIHPGATGTGSFVKEYNDEQ